VWTAGPSSGELPTWRGRVLPYVDGRPLLGEPASGPASALLAFGAAADDPNLVILGLDEVLGTVEITSDTLKPFPPGLADAHRLFDRIATVPGETTSLLRLRPGLDLTAYAAIRIPAPIFA
jgi:hypothetical protein